VKKKKRTKDVVVDVRLYGVESLTATTYRWSSTTPSASTSVTAPVSGVQLGSGCPCHHNLGRPEPPNIPEDCDDDGTPLPTPRSQRISSSPPSTPWADTSAGFPKMAPMAPLPPPELLLLLLFLLVLGGRRGEGGGRWTRRNGRGEACAVRRQWRVKADSETRSAIGGGSFSAAVCVGFGSSLRTMDSDGWGSILLVLVLVLAAAAYLYTTPSSSRKYAGPIFLFSALHCARTRNLRRFAIAVQPTGATVASRGSGV